MSRHAVQPMESYDLAQYAVQVPCYICGGGNTFDAELCRHCQAPMALSHQANFQKTPPRMVAALGPAASGKTVFLGMLADVLSRQTEIMQVLARGAFSISLQQTTIGALSRCEFPGKTPNEPDRWNWMHCQVTPEKRRAIELIMPDPAGEAILEEIDHPHSFPVIRSFLSQCVAAMLMVDATRLEEGESEQDFFAMKIISYLCELDGDPKSGWPRRPMAVIFTKADQSETCLASPSEYAQKHTPGLWRLCRDRIHETHFFATGIAGSCASRYGLGLKTRIPLRVEPRGVLEPFAWLIDQISQK